MSALKTRIARAQEQTDTIAARQWFAKMEALPAEELAEYVTVQTRTRGHSPYWSQRTEEEFRQQVMRSRHIVLDFLRRKSLDMVRRHRIARENSR